MLGLVHHQHAVQVRLNQDLVNALLAEAELNKLDVLVLRQFQLVGSLRHLLALVDLGHLDSIKVIGHTYALHVAISHKYFNLVQVIVLSLEEEERVVKDRLPVLLQLVLRDETLRRSLLLRVPYDLDKGDVILVQGFHFCLSTTHILL